MVKDKIYPTPKALCKFHHSGKEGVEEEEEEEEALTPEYEGLSGTPEYVDDGDNLEEEQKSRGVDDGLMQ